MREPMREQSIATTYQTRVRLCIASCASPHYHRHWMLSQFNMFVTTFRFHIDATNKKRDPVYRVLLSRVLPLTVVFCAAASCLASPKPPSAGHLAPPTQLRSANREEPLAVVETTPEFSWRLIASSPRLHSVSQTAYRIQVAATDSDLTSSRGIIWESGNVHSQSVSGIAYTGPPLEAAHAYAWHVRVWDERGRSTGWSPTAHWTQAPVWHASWITNHPTGSDDDEEPLPLFRKSFNLSKPVKRAILYASGLGQDELHLNGVKVGQDQLTPGWSDYRKTVYYDSYDVTSQLRQGQNALGILLGNGMYRAFKTKGRYTKFTGAFGPLKCIVQLRIEMEGGEVAEIDSDATWKTHSGPITFSSTYGGEDFDAQRQPIGWDAPAFNDSDWRSAEVVDGPGGILLPELAPPIRIMHTYQPIKRTEPKSGILVYDLGQNFAGWPSISVTGPAGAIVKLVPGELLSKDGTVSQRSSGAPQWFSYTLRGSGIEHWHPRFSYYGFRYVQVEGAGVVSAPGQARIISLSGDAVHSSSSSIGEFSSSDDQLNRIHTLILRAIENNAVSLFTDCPHREKLGWLEETHLLAPSMLYDFDFAGLYSATARNIADTQSTDPTMLGMIPEIAPQYVVFDPKYGVFNDSPEWGSAAVLAPWYVYQRYGDLHFLAAQLDVMRSYVAYLATRSHDGIIDYGLGDWYDIGPGPPGFSKLTTAGVTATAIYYQDLRVLEKTTALLGMMNESDQFRLQAESVRDAFNARFFDPVLHRYDKGSQTAQAMPLSLGMVPDAERASVIKTLVEDIRTHQNHVTAGDIGYHYVVDALLDGGRSDVLLDMLERTDTPSYGFQLAQGATALTEAWDANPASSQDHFMLGDAEEWLYRGLGGINVDLSRQGADRLVLHPVVDNRIRWVRTHYDSALGLVKSEWSRGSKATVFNFTIPVNALATIKIETTSPATITVNGTPSSKAVRATSMQSSKNSIQIVLGSGKYEIHAANAATSHNE
jgi:hypothetical protein